MSNQRVAAILYRMGHRQPLIAVHVPAKSDMADDFSVTTVTTTIGSRENKLFAVSRGICSLLGITEASIELEQPLTTRPFSAKGKSYHWVLVRTQSSVRFNANSREIRELYWCCPAELPTMLDQMSEDRRKMFCAALQLAVMKEPILVPFLTAIKSAFPEKIPLMVDA